MSVRDLLWQLLALGGVVDPANVQKVAYTATAGVSTVLARNTPYLLIATTDAHIKFGYNNAVAAVAANDLFIPAKIPMVFFTGDFSFVSAIQDAAGGTLWIAKVSQDAEARQTSSTGQFGA